MAATARDENKMYQFQMPTERIKREYKEQLSIKDSQIARLRTRMATLETFVPEGVAVDDDGELSVSITKAE